MHRPSTKDNEQRLTYIEVCVITRSRDGVTLLPDLLRAR